MRRGAPLLGRFDVKQRTTTRRDPSADRIYYDAW